MAVSARAHERPHVYVPAGFVVEAPVETYRCAVGPVYNFYDGAWYCGRVPAVYRDYVYRPYYRYTAYRTRLSEADKIRNSLSTPRHG
jgi:hypothetical protein